MMEDTQCSGFLARFDLLIKMDLSSYCQISQKTNKSSLILITLIFLMDSYSRGINLSIRQFERITGINKEIILQYEGCQQSVPLTHSSGKTSEILNLAAFVYFFVLYTICELW